MYKKVFISLLIILSIISISNISTSMNESHNSEKDVIINNINNKDIDVRLVDINKFVDSIDIGEKYSYYAILTMRVENKGKNYIELANIDIYPYQGDKSTKYFVNTSNDNINGFIGTLNSGENIYIKIGVALYNNDESIKINLVTSEDIIQEYK
ncbi:hypothetical protein EAI30_04025 [Romboutsia ilealis]|uniref:DUF4352 domain-containing protein n=1 Tax=Romboutsia faecis TaxID=2764597 RepID=A0ABR7JKZ7_9FIRM|nr:hypothetical protein [Romboutsia faecis]MBC5995580.1 hypothetical protein [Romboutsia faecis]MRN23782.1 hypothetical protein [Romboutsia ilealis]